MRNSECIVVGGGLIGLLTAFELRRAGVAVTVLERGEAGRGASWAGAGILSTLHPWRSPAELVALIDWGQRHYPAYAGELAELSGIDPQWQRSGLLVLEGLEHEAALAWGRQSGHSVRLLSPEEAQAVEPGLRRPLEPCLWVPEVGQVRNPRLLKALRVGLERLGVRIVEHSPVRQLLREGDSIVGVATDEGRLSAAAVVIAGGAWSAGILKDLGITLDIAPVRGQMLLYRSSPGLVRRLLIRNGHYVVPRRDGHILVGSTAEDVGFDPSTTEDVARKLREAASAMVPALGEHTVVQHWAGLRPGSRDGIPTIGEHPKVRGLYFNTGHHRNGILLAPGSARLLRELMLEQTPSITPVPYRVDARQAA